MHSVGDPEVWDYLRAAMERGRTFSVDEYYFKLVRPMLERWGYRWYKDPGSMSYVCFPPLLPPLPSDWEG